jgi:hypothetical protein
MKGATEKFALEDVTVPTLQQYILIDNVKCLGKIYTQTTNIGVCFEELGNMMSQIN